MSWRDSARIVFAVVSIFICASEGAPPKKGAPKKEGRGMRIMNYPEDFDADYSVPRKAKRTVSPALKFTPPTAAVISEKRLEVEGKPVVMKDLISATASLSNPTNKPVPVVFWLGTFRLELIESAEIKVKPPDPNGPPRPPPVPPPPFRITIPPRTTVMFTGWVYPDGYIYQGSPEAKVKWSMLFADGPKPGGELSIKVPPRNPGTAEAGKSPVPARRQDTQSLLKKWESIPDLLQIAREQAKGGDAYALQSRLEAEYSAGKKLFRITTVFRHMDECATKEHRFAATTLFVVNPKGESVEMTGVDLHEVEVHHGAFPPEIAAFLRNLPE